MKNLYSRIWAYIGPLLVIFIFVFWYVLQADWNQKIQERDALYSARLAEIAAREKLASYMDIETFTQTNRQSIKSLYEKVMDKSLPRDLRADLELDAFWAKLPILQQFLTMHQEVLNRSFRILSLVENVFYLKGNKAIQKKISISAQYEQGIPPDRFKFLLFMEICLNPPPPKDLKLDILINSKREATYEVIPIGAPPDSTSPLYVVAIDLNDSDLNRHDIVRIEVSTPETDQQLPFSIHDIHVHRYAEGIDTVRSVLYFSNAVRVKSFYFDIAKQELIPVAKGSDFTILEGSSSKTEEEGYYTRYAFEAHNPKNPIVVTFLELIDPKAPVSLP